MCHPRTVRAAPENARLGVRHGPGAPDIEEANREMERALKRSPVVLAVVVVSMVANADPHKPAIGDTEVVAPVPAIPGSPGAIAVNGHKLYVSAAMRFGTAGNNVPSII